MHVYKLSVDVLRTLYVQLYMLELSVEGFVYGLNYAIETMAQRCNSAMVEGLRLRLMGCLNVGGNNGNPNYTMVGFDLHGSGGDGGLMHSCCATSMLYAS